MKQAIIGLVLMISSFLVWFIAIAILFDYNVNVLHPDHSSGEPIWNIDRVGFMIISIPTGLVFLVGLVVILRDIMSEAQ